MTLVDVSSDNVKSYNSIQDMPLLEELIFLSTFLIKRPHHTSYFIIFYCT